MTIIEPKDQSIKKLKGLHLWHDDLSSCSQRVRAVLSIKNLDWESHLLAIPKGDTTTPEYLAINPKGLVPVLVHDGMLMTESTYIIDYLDQTYPVPALHPNDPALVAQMNQWLALADGAQYDLKVLSHEFLFRAARDVSAADVENFENNVDNEVLVKFIRVYHEQDRLPEDMIAESVDRTDEWFRQLDEVLNGRRWLVGDALSLADIAWMPNVHRFELMDWPMERYPHLVAWHKQIKDTKAYQYGILQWEPPPAREMLTGFVRAREQDGYHVRNFGSLAN